MTAPRFPAARLKKIIQMDEDVGRVEKLTPIALSKALELYLTDLLAAAAKESGGSGTSVQPHHLRRAIDKDPKFDFLKDVVKDVPIPEGPDSLAAAARPAKKKARQPTVKGARKRKAAALGGAGGAAAAGASAETAARAQLRAGAAAAAAAAAPPVDGAGTGANAAAAAAGVGAAAAAAAVAAAAASGGTRYVCQHLAVVRSSYDMNSPRLGTLQAGQEVVALEERHNATTGQTRVRFGGGWTSKTSSTGAVVLAPLASSSGTAAASSSGDAGDGRGSSAAVRSATLARAIRLMRRVDAPAARSAGASSSVSAAASAAGAAAQGFVDDDDYDDLDDDEDDGDSDNDDENSNENDGDVSRQ